jgi:hypothetical protein
MGGNDFTDKVGIVHGPTTKHVTEPIRSNASGIR